MYERAAQGLGVERVRLEPFSRLEPCWYAGCEAAVCVAAGSVDVYSGRGMREWARLGLGGHVSIAEGGPYLLTNPGETAAVVVLACTTQNMGAVRRKVEVPGWLAPRVAGMRVQE